MQGSIWALFLLFLVGAGCRPRGDRSSRGSAPLTVPAEAIGPAAPVGSVESHPPVVAISNQAASELIRRAREQLPLADSDAACVPAVRRLAREDPELLLLVARLRAIELGRFARPCLSDERLADALRTHSASDQLVTTLEARSQWRFEAQLPWLEAAHWLLQHSERVFVQTDPRRLERLLAAPHLADDSSRSGLLVALIHLEPKAARERLLDWAPRLKGPDARFVALFMREHSVSLAPRAWVDEADERCTERRARAVFDGMRRADRGALPTLLAYLDAADAHWAERPLAVRAFIDALIRLGAPAKRFTCRNELFDPCRMTSLRGAEQERNARIACLSAARAWLLVNGGLPQSAQGH